MSLSCYYPRVRRSHLLATLLPATMIGASCAVFPDRAVLPGTVEEGDVGAAGVSTGDRTTSARPHVDGQGGEMGESVPVHVGAVDGAPAVTAGTSAGEGAGGAAGEPSCPHSVSVRIAVEADAWLDAAERNAQHGEEAVLSVRGGEAERRAIFAIVLPPPPPGAVLERATFVLHLLGNADTSLRRRRLSLHRLKTPFAEGRASWARSDSGSKWQLPGGDYGPEVSRAVVRVGTERGDVSFDLSEAMAKAGAEAPLTFALIVLEKSDSAASASELSFASKDQATHEAPSLVLDYCDEN